MLDRLEANLARLLESEPAPGAPLDEAVREKVREIVTMVAEIPAAEWAGIAGQCTDITTVRPLMRRLYARYITEQELWSVAAQLQRSAHGKAGADDGLVLDDWGRKAYERVDDLFVHGDFGACQRLVMVGCGPLPVTLIHILHRTSIPHLIALDSDPAVISTVEKLVRRFGWTRIEPVCAAGESFDYSDADVVYLANLLSPKSAILEHVARQVRSGTQVILRDPIGGGDLFAEVGRPERHTLLEIELDGAGDGHFLSRDVFLRKR